MTDENLDIETSEEVEIQEEETVSKADYDEAMATAEKYKGYFKKEKAKQKNAKTDSKDVDISSLKTEIMQEVTFYNANPKASQYKEGIDGYVNKGLTHDEAFRLVASKENPSLLVDQQAINQATAGQKELTGVPEANTENVDYSTRTKEDLSSATTEESNNHWDAKMKG